jgi:hypothetical protein
MPTICKYQLLPAGARAVVMIFPTVFSAMPLNAASQYSSVVVWLEQLTIWEVQSWSRAEDTSTNDSQQHNNDVQPHSKVSLETCQQMEFNG